MLVWLAQDWRVAAGRRTRSSHRRLNSVCCAPCVVASSFTLARFSVTSGRTRRRPAIAVICAVSVDIVRRQPVPCTVTQPSTCRLTGDRSPARTASVASYAPVICASTCAFTRATGRTAAPCVVELSRAPTHCSLTAARMPLSPPYYRASNAGEHSDQQPASLRIRDSASVQPTTWLLLKSFMSL